MKPNFNNPVTYHLFRILSWFLILLSATLEFDSHYVNIIFAIAGAFCLDMTTTQLNPKITTHVHEKYTLNGLPITDPIEIEKARKRFEDSKSDWRCMETDWAQIQRDFEKTFEEFKIFIKKK